MFQAFFATRWAQGALLAASLTTISLVGCSGSKGNPTSNSASADTVSVDPGKPLFAATEYKPVIRSNTAPSIQVNNGNVIVLNRLEIPANVDGTILFIGAEIPEEQADLKDSKNYFKHQSSGKVYKRLREGDFLNMNQTVAIIDDEIVFQELKIAKVKIDAAIQEATGLGDAVKAIKVLQASIEGGTNTGSVALQELQNVKVQVIRYQVEYEKANGATALTKAEYEKAKAMYSKYFSFSRTDGFIQSINKVPGAGVKATEPIMEVVDIQRLRVEANLPREYLGSVNKGDEVTIEIARDIGPQIAYEQHTTNRPIVALAVAQVDGKAVIASAGDDGGVHLWDANLKTLEKWKCASAVKSLAVTPPGADKPLLCVGLENGTASIHDLTSYNAKPLVTLDGKHNGGVFAAAFSPDGKYVVTSDEKSIYMYDANNGKKLYRFAEREHYSAITSLSFTPQGRVVSVGKEPSVRVWIVGEQGAKIEHRLDARGGDVPALGVSPDGQKLLLDVDKSRLDVIDLSDASKDQPLEVFGESARFQQFAVWSPVCTKDSDQHLIATLGNDERIVQLWKAPTSKARAQLHSRLFCRDGAAASCAAFFPGAEADTIVVGTKKGFIQLWKLPKTSDLVTDIKATILHVEQGIDTSGRSVKMLVDFNNQKVGNGFLVKPGTTVNLQITPAAK